MKKQTKKLHLQIEALNVLKASRASEVNGGARRTGGGGGGSVPVTPIGTATAP